MVQVILEGWKQKYLQKKHNKPPKEVYGDLYLASTTDKKASDLAEFPSWHNENQGHRSQE
jgi:hypothetical protein